MGAPADSVAMSAAELERRLSLDEGREKNTRGEERPDRLISHVFCCVEVCDLLQACVPFVVFHLFVRYWQSQPGIRTLVPLSCFLCSDTCVGAFLFFGSRGFYSHASRLVGAYLARTD